LQFGFPYQYSSVGKPLERSIFFFRTALIFLLYKLLPFAFAPPVALPLFYRSTRKQPRLRYQDVLAGADANERRLRALGAALAVAVVTFVMRMTSGA
jgi:hypothetical protein